MQALDHHIFRYLDLQQPISSWEVADFNLEMDQRLKKSGSRSLGAIDNPPAAGVPSARSPQRTNSREGQMVADSPEDHLCGHALVYSVQQIFDEAGACFSRDELERAAVMKLSFGGSEPAP